MINFTDFLNAWNNAPMRHAMVVHLPIALSMVGTLLALAAAVLPKNVTLRITAIAAYAILIAVTILAVNSGEHAEHEIPVMTAEIRDLVHDHEWMAEKVWFFAGGAFILLCVSSLKRTSLRNAAHWLAVLTAVAGMLWVGRTAHLGGELVYGHGIGTPGAEAVSHAMADSTMQAQPANNVSDADAAAHVAFFRDQIAPILEFNCLQCHNPEKSRRAGRLDLTTHAAALKGGRSGPVIVPGNPDASLLVQRIRGDDPEEDIMPPNGRLSNAMLAKIEQWIHDGAHWGDAALSVPREDDATQ